MKPSSTFNASDEWLAQITCCGDAPRRPPPASWPHAGPGARGPRSRSSPPLNGAKSGVAVRLRSPSKGFRSADAAGLLASRGSAERSGRSHARCSFNSPRAQGGRRIPLERMPSHVQPPAYE
ncbi:hypothetical protein AAFF_G00331680 [Aldrovandia affinis]|uniref:Uncharacterized protein n=1 Tax=Aldrovandia affinis TaxID=143900 RepID=A0AAD7SNG9_9TELE|nr:hypothetical protein AAFF_G00331680 [Aldrovandia affinis]